MTDEETLIFVMTCKEIERLAADVRLGFVDAIQGSLLIVDHLKRLVDVKEGVQ